MLPATYIYSYRIKFSFTSRIQPSKIVGWCTEVGKKSNECPRMWYSLCFFGSISRSRRGKHGYVRAVWWVKEAPGCWKYDVGF